MTLRVYLKQTDGETNFIDFGLNADNYDAVIKTEIREDSNKIKTYSGSKYVGIPEIDDPPKPKPTPKKQKTKTFLPEYEIFNYKVHDTDREYYWVSAVCSNCDESCQVAIPRKQKIDRRGFKYLFCPKCGVEKSLHYARWNHQKKKHERVLK
ncbi:MAG: hypothetical protein ACR2LL_08675 [Nitrosopumilus sp.]